MKKATQTKLEAALAGIQRRPIPPAEDVTAAARSTWADTLAAIEKLGEIARANGGGLTCSPVVPSASDTANGITRWHLDFGGPSSSTRVQIVAQGSKIGPSDAAGRTALGMTKPAFLATEQDAFIDAIAELLAKTMAVQAASIDAFAA